METETLAEKPTPPAPSTLDLYTVYVQTITAAEQRRNQVALAYLAVISIVAGLIGIYDETDALWFVGPIGALALLWFLNMLYFRSLAKAKFEVIKDLEKDWEYKPFAQEWEYLHSMPGYKRVSLSMVETTVPLLICLAAASYVAWRLWC